jgi:hypothetical protein
MQDQNSSMRTASGVSPFLVGKNVMLGRLGGEKVLCLRKAPIILLTHLSGFGKREMLSPFQLSY